MAADVDYMTRLGVYHYCLGFSGHTGNGTREQRVFGKLTSRWRPSDTEEWPGVLYWDGYERALEVYKRLGGT